jgi:hypothetical protein
VLGVALLAVAGVAYVLGYRGGSSPPAETTTTQTVAQPPPPAPPPAESVSVSPYTATVTWTTAAPSTAELQWGPAASEPVLWDSVEAPASRHVVKLVGLASSTAYRLSLVSTSAGQTEQKELSFTTEPAPTQVQGTVENGVLLVNGEPFFPLLTWQQCPVQWGDSLVAGINLFAVGSPCSSPSSTASDLAGRALVVAADGSSGPLGSFYPDEADARGLTGASLPALPAGLRFLTLTAHFASMAAPLPSGRGMYPALVAAADVVGFDFYPLQELCRRDLLAADFDAQRELEALAPGKPTFQWIESRGMRCGTSPDVAISAATIRTESWLALAAGAHGLGFFPPDWDSGAVSAISGISARIRQLEPALLQPVQPVSVDGSPDVRASARTYNGAVYVIAVNAGTTASSPHFTVPGLGDRMLHVLGRPTLLPAKGDVFTDTLGPLRTRIYAAAPRTGDAQSP